MAILEQHANALPEGRTSKSDLLFPSNRGGYQASSCLAKPIVAIAEAVKITKHLSPYFMRRTFQDLCRAANVHDFVARAISGHATVEMQQLYSSVDGSEVRSGLAKVISLAGFRQAREAEENGGDRLSEASSDDDLRTGSGDAKRAGGDRGGDQTERSLTMRAR
jgi:site-specific recombinase XerC